MLSIGSEVGIAVPQVGINRNVIWGKLFDKDGKPLEYFLNPVILRKLQLQNLGSEGIGQLQILEISFTEVKSYSWSIQI